MRWRKGLRLVCLQPRRNSFGGVLLLNSNPFRLLRLSIIPSLRWILGGFKLELWVECLYLKTFQSIEDRNKALINQSIKGWFQSFKHWNGDAASLSPCLQRFFVSLHPQIFRLYRPSIGIKYFLKLFIPRCICFYIPLDLFKHLIHQMHSMLSCLL